MEMTDTIFRLQMTMGLVWWGVIAAWFVLPWLYRKPFHAALLVPLLVAALRFHGLNFLVPQANDGLSADFAVPAAWGDFAVCLIALSAAVALRFRSNAGVALAWAYGILGALDFGMGFYLGEVHRMPSTLGSTWFMVTQEAPLQIVALVVLFRTLLKHPGRSAESSANA